MDYVYICRDGTNEELRYSIRSLVKNTNCSRVILVGGKPDWYIGEYIQVNNIGNKFKNITNCYKIICNSSLVSDDFILMNDDFFVMDQTTHFPTAYNGTLENKIINHINKHGYTGYSHILANANKQLKNIVNNPLNYDVHMPMIFNKEKLKEVVGLSLAPRSMYGNIFNIGGLDIEDVKIYEGEIFDKKSIPRFISTEDNSFNVVLPLLKQLFPEPTIYEKLV